MYINLLELPVYYINLDREVSKRNNTEALLKGMGFSTIERVAGIEHPDPRVGCARSHHMVMANVKAPFILLEDDLGHNDLKLSYEMPDDAHCLYLGVSQWGRFLNFSGPFTTYSRVTDEVVRVYNMLSAHAVVHLDPDYQKHLAQIAWYSGYEHHYHMDVGYAETQKYYKVYALDSPIFYQTGYNEKVTNQRISAMCMDKLASDKLFEETKYNLKLTGVPDIKGNHSFYDPRF